MGFFDSIFSSQETIPDHWKKLEQVTMLDQLVSDSFQKPVVIYKHSTTCGLSQMKKNGLVEHWDLSPEDLDFYYLDLLRLRPISNEIESKFGILHESPQLIILKDGKVKFHTSHHQVTVESIKKALGI